MHQLEPDDINTEQKVRLILVLAEHGYSLMANDHAYTKLTLLHGLLHQPLSGLYTSGPVRLG